MSSLSEQRMNSITKFSSNVQPTFPPPQTSQKRKTRTRAEEENLTFPLPICNCLPEHKWLSNANHASTYKEIKSFLSNRIICFSFLCIKTHTIFIRDEGDMTSDKISGHSGAAYHNKLSIHRATSIYVKILAANSWSQKLSIHSAASVLSPDSH